MKFNHSAFWRNRLSSPPFVIRCRRSRPRFHSHSVSGSAGPPVRPSDLPRPLHPAPQPLPQPVARPSSSSYSHGCQMTIARSYVFGPSGFWTMALLRYAAKLDPFLSLDSSPMPFTLVQFKERKGSHFCHLATLTTVPYTRLSLSFSLSLSRRYSDSSAARRPLLSWMIVKALISAGKEQQQ